MDHSILPQYAFTVLLMIKLFNWKSGKDEGKKTTRSDRQSTGYAITGKKIIFRTTMVVN